MKKIQYTSWQLWAQSYTANNEALEGGLIDKEDADRYAHAAWNACRAKCLEILESNKSSYMPPDAPSLQISPDIEFIEFNAIDEVEKL